MPRGPWVLVVGMHRSGTSALTGALGRLGLALPAGDDLVTGRYDNPVHYESRALNDLDDAILGALGGSWSAPPTPAPGWESSPAVLGVTAGAARCARRAFPGAGPVVWKDPRLCLLLPAWRSLLPAPIVTILLWRQPLAVARSLRARQGFPPSLGLALWERYTRAALTGLSGHPGYVMSYEELLADPGAALGPLARWLHGPGRVPLAVDDDMVSAAASSVTGGSAGHGDGELPEVIISAVETLQALSGPHDALPAHSGVDPPSWMADVIAQRHEYEELYARYMRYVRLRRKIPFLGGR
ncbi:MAG TPA: hypothetical protein VII76_03835 [Acidimicrobiales bacterium]